MFHLEFIEIFNFILFEDFIMSTKPFRLLIFSFVCFLLLGSFHTILAQRYGTERFKQKYEINSDKVLHVNIDIDAAQVRISKSSRSKEVWLSIYFSEDEFKIYEDYDRKRSRLDIEFDKKGWTNNDSKDLKAEFVLELPPDVEIYLEARIKAGVIEIDLGGLSIVGMELTTWAGEVQVEFSEPNQSEMDYLKINTKVGETKIVRLGNARFREAEINGGIGEMRVDFRGRMLNEAMADVDLDIGETTIYLPDDDVGVKLSVSKFLFLSDVEVPRNFRKSGRYYYSKNYDDAKYALRLHVSPGLGALNIN